MYVPFVFVDRRRQVLRWIEEDGSAKSFFCDAGCGGERLRGARLARPYCCTTTIQAPAVFGYLGIPGQLEGRERATSRDEPM